MIITKVNDNEFDIDGSRFTLFQLKDLKKNTENFIPVLEKQLEDENKKEMPDYSDMEDDGNRESMEEGWVQDHESKITALEYSLDVARSSLNDYVTFFEAENITA